MTSRALIRIKNTHANDEMIRRLCNDDRYIVHSNGKIESMIQRTGKLSSDRSFRVVKPYSCASGYQRIKYNYKDLFVHRIVYQKFVGDLDSSLVINHIDGNPSNNDFTNLEQVSHQQNMDHLVKLLKKKNTSLNQKRINFETAEKIRSEFKDQAPIKILSEKYGISVPSVKAVLKNKTWRQKNV